MIERVNSCAGDSSADPASSQDYAGEIRRPSVSRRYAQRSHPGVDRTYRRGRRHRLRRRVCRQRNPWHVHRGRLTICNLPSSLAPRWGWSHRMKRPSNISAAGVMPPGGNMGKCRRGLASLRAIQMQCLIGSHF